MIDQEYQHIDMTKKQSVRAHQGKGDLREFKLLVAVGKTFIVLEQNNPLYFTNDPLSKKQTPENLSCPKYLDRTKNFRSYNYLLSLKLFFCFISSTFPKNRY